MTFWFSEKVSLIWTCVAITPDYNHVAYQMFWFSEQVSRIWTCVVITPDYNHVAYHDVFDSLRQRFPQSHESEPVWGPSKQFHPSWSVVRNGSIFAKITYFSVPQNSSLPREVSLETVHFLSILPENGPFLGPLKSFYTSWSVVRNGSLFVNFTRKLSIFGSLKIVLHLVKCR